MSSSLKVSVKLQLAFKSGNRCAFPDCNQLLTADATEHDDGVIIGEAAHIRGEKTGSQRHDENYLTDKVNEYDNLIYLCPNHHTLIDKQGSTYTVEEIIGWKERHEQWIREKTEDAVVDVTFAELEIVTQALINSTDLSML